MPLDTSAPELAHLPFRPNTAPSPRGRFVLLAQPRSSLVAAACLLLLFGLAMPQPGFLSAPRTVDKPRLDGCRRHAVWRSPARSGPLSRRTVGPGELPANPILQKDPPVSRPGVHPVAGALPQPARAYTTSRAPPLPASPRQDPRSISPRKAAELNRMAFLYTTNGELTRAVSPLHQAHWMCQEKLGPNHPTTQKTSSLPGKRLPGGPERPGASFPRPLFRQGCLSCRPDRWGRRFGEYGPCFAALS